MNKMSSNILSTLASHVLKMTPAETTDPDLLDTAKKLAGSVMSNDEIPGQNHGIHPAPEEFTAEQIAETPLLHFFHYAHLPEKLQGTSKAFFLLAHHVVNTVPRNAERTVALRKLLEAKDAAVRANLPSPKLPGQGELPISPKPELGEPVEIGGHNEDRDGPVPFDA